MSASKLLKQTKLFCSQSSDHCILISFFVLKFMSHMITITGIKRISYLRQGSQSGIEKCTTFLAITTFDLEVIRDSFCSTAFLV